MNDNTVGRVHITFWIIGIAALIFNGMGIMNYLMQMNPETLASYPESHRTIIDGRPPWATGGFAIAVFAGALGCLLLLLRRSAAFYLFVLSLLGVIAATLHTLGVINEGARFTSGEIAMMVVMPVVVALFLVWYAKFAERKNWIR